MTALTANLRKAAILIRSVDADTAAVLLAQLSPTEAKAVRAAIQSLGPVDPEERADVAAEFRRAGPLATEDPRQGVDFEISSAAAEQSANPSTAPIASRPFDFLEHARVESLVPYLAREHGQTIAIVLSYLAPARAAQVLAALPPRLQSDAVERLLTLGDIDPGSVQVLERELADWVGRQRATRSRDVRRTDSIAAILAAADDSTRNRILGNVAQHNRQLAEQIAPPAKRPVEIKAQAAPPAPPREAPRAIASPPKPRPTMPFEDLTQLDKPTLAAVLRAVDAEVLVLALAGASDALVERIAEPMPRPTANAFRRRLRQLGPTRLRDVEAAQHEIACIAVQLIQSQLAPGSAIAR
jgi:flagellar motor switch protein FliG